MSKCIDNRISKKNSVDDDNNIYTNLEYSSANPKVLLPLKVNKIIDCVTLTEEQNRFLGKITLNISCNSELLSNTIGGEICIESIGVNYTNITVIDPQIIMTINSNEVSLNQINGMDNKFEGKINTFNNCCYSKESYYMRNLITVSRIETFMNNGLIIVNGNICGVNFCAQAVYDGYLNGNTCTYTIVNNARLIQSGVVVATSGNTETIIGDVGILNQYNANNFYGFLCLKNCSNNWINAYFDNEFSINCITPAEAYDGSGTFEAYIYGKYKSSLNLYSITKEDLPVYTDKYK